MQAYVCGQCGHSSSYDPWTETARCSHCGYTPPRAKRTRGRRRPRERTGTHQPFLDELVAHWNGTHSADFDFALQTSELAVAFFQHYQRALGEDPNLGPGRHMGYVRNYHPRREEILSFVGAYLLLRHGSRDHAARRLRDLTILSPKFADPWIWLTALVGPEQRPECLENALALEPAHPLARDALAIARGKVAPVVRRPGGALKQPVVSAECRRCGASLHYEPGADGVECPHCGHRLPLQQANLVEEEATPIGDLQLRRRYRGQVWQEVQRIVHCQSCGAELIMTRQLARQCLFCASTSVLLEDNYHSFEQPDGFLPFRVNEQEAAAAIQRAQHSGLRGIKTWLTGKEHRVSQAGGVYLPFWVFDGFVEVRTWATDRFSQYTPPQGMAPPGDIMMFDNLVLAGTSMPPASLLTRTYPYRLDGLVPYEPHLLADWPAALYQLDVEVVAEDAYDEMIAMARKRAGSVITSESSDSSGAAVVRRSFQVSNPTYQLVLLPVWVAILSHQEERRLALVNGQTAKVAFGPAISSDRETPLTDDEAGA